VNDISNFKRKDPSRVATEADRRAYVRDWIARRLNGKAVAATGLLSTVLSLPMVAAAQVAQQFVKAGGIDGVRDVQVMDDGSVQLQMSNGVTVSVPASDVQITGAGEVLVSDRVVEVAADVMAAAGGGGLGAGVIAAGGLAGAGAIAAAASGGGDSDGGSPPPPVLNGDSFASSVLGVTGGFNSANTGITLPEGTTSVEVTITTEDGQEDPVTVTPNPDGTWTTPEFKFIPQGNVTVTVRSLDENGDEIESTTQDFNIDTIPPTITIDDTGVGDDGVLNITEQGAGITVSGTTDAEDGQTVTVRLDEVTVERSISGAPQLDGNGSTPYTATVSGGTWSVFIPGTTLAQVSGDGSLRVTADVEDAAGNAADNATEIFTFDLTAPGISIDAISGDNQIGLLDVQGDLEITGSTNAEIGQRVTLSISGQEFTGAVISNSMGGAEPNAWSVTVPQSVIAAIQTQAAAGDGTLSGIPVTATVTDAAGNVAQTPAIASIDADFNGPSIAIDDIAVDNVINAVESSSDVTISGTTNNVPEGQDVTVRLGGAVLATDKTGPNGAWQVTLPRADLPEDGASVNITADVSDGETDAPQASVTLAADFTAPTISIGTVSDGVINLAESTEPLTISGTTDAEPNQTVTLAVPGVTDPVTATVGADGTWSATLTAAQTTAFVDGQDGQTPQITADVSDAAGNPATTATRTVAVDTTAPQVTVNAPALGGDAVLNIVEAGSPLVLSGTVSEQTDFTVTLNGSALSNVTVTGTDWTVSVPATTLQALPPDATIDITAEATDAAGNTGSQSISFDTDLTAPEITITDTGVVADGFLNIADQAAGITFEGNTTGVENGETVKITLSGVSGAPIEASGVVTDNRFSVEFTSGDLSTIGGWPSATVTATVADAAGNPATPAKDSFNIDLAAPTIAFDDPPPDGFVLELAERDTLDTDGIAVITSEPNGTPVVLTFTRADGTEDVRIETAVSNDGVFDILLTQAQIDALQDQTTYTLELMASDQAGNTGSANLTIPTDFAPTLTIDEVGVDGAVDLSDTAGASITGTTLGVEQGRFVMVTVTGATSGQVLNATAEVGADGKWSLPVAPAVFDALVPGEIFDVSADVENAAGRPAMFEQSGIDAYLASAFLLAEIARSGSDSEIALFGQEDSFPGGLSSAQVTFTSAAGAVSAFPDSDPSTPEIEANTQGSGIFVLNGNDPSNANLGIIAIPAINNFDDPLATYIASLGDTGSAIEVTTSSDRSDGTAQLLLGTAGADTLIASNTDSVIQGKGGNDTIDVSATGTDIVVFELDQASNGTDTVIGFTTGNTFQSDEIVLLGRAHLRGNGDVAETLGAGGTLGADTGFVIFSTALADTDAATLDAAFEGLAGEAAGDEIYFLAGDGTDAALARVTVTAPDDASVEILAHFNGIGDLTLLNPDNVSLPDPAIG
jgi:hypothetical protein